MRQITPWQGIWKWELAQTVSCFLPAETGWICLYCISTSGLTNVSSFSNLPVYVLRFFLSSIIRKKDSGTGRQGGRDGGGRRRKGGGREGWVHVFFVGHCQFCFFLYCGMQLPGSHCSSQPSSILAKVIWQVFTPEKEQKWSFWEVTLPALLPRRPGNDSKDIGRPSPRREAWLLHDCREKASSDKACFWPLLWEIVRVKSLKCWFVVIAVIVLLTNTI